MPCQASIDLRRTIELHLQQGRSFATAFTAFWDIPPAVGGAAVL